MFPTVIEAMFSPEGLIVGAAWVALWAAIVCTAILLMEARERRAMRSRMGGEG